MKAIVTFFAFIFFFGITHAETLAKVRALYPSSIQSASTAKQFGSVISKMKLSDPVIKGYKYAAEIAEAKFAKSLEQKKTILKSSIGKLEQLIHANPNNAELRLIRMSIQENLPKVVGYNKELGNDKQFLIQHYSQQKADLKQYIYNFAAQSKSFSSAEKAALK